MANLGCCIYLPRGHLRLWDLHRSDDRHHAVRLPHHSKAKTRNSRSVYRRLLVDLLVLARIPLANHRRVPLRLCTSFPRIPHEPHGWLPWKWMGQAISNHLPRRSLPWFHSVPRHLPRIATTALQRGRKLLGTSNFSVRCHAIIPADICVGRCQVLEECRENKKFRLSIA